MKFILDILLPRETKFFKFMAQQIDVLYKASLLFKDIISNIETLKEEDLKQKLAQIKAYEKEGDALELTIIIELEKTFITPLDREDIHTIALALDRALDILNSIAQKIDIYQIRKAPKNAPHFADLIIQISNELKAIIPALEKRENLETIVTKMHSLENNADYLFHCSMADLFSDHYSPIEIIKFKELYEHLEDVVDAIDFIGKKAQSIMIKYR